jgi:hypothetical protein
VSLSLLFPSDPCEVAPARAFYCLRSGNYNESRGPAGDLRTGQILCCWAQWLGVANDVFNDVDISDLIVCHPVLGQWYDMVPLRH